MIARELDRRSERRQSGRSAIVETADQLHERARKECRTLRKEADVLVTWIGMHHFKQATGLEVTTIPVYHPFGPDYKNMNTLLAEWEEFYLPLSKEDRASIEGYHSWIEDMKKRASDYTMLKQYAESLGLGSELKMAKEKMEKRLGKGELMWAG